MDRWLTAVERDHSRTPLPQKVIRDKPSDLTDECWDGIGTKLSSSLCPGGVVNVEGNARQGVRRPPPVGREGGRGQGEHDQRELSHASDIPNFRCD
jgi:hypothetical protein